MAFELEGVDQYAAINNYLRPFHSRVWLKKGDQISNPFIDKKQKTPSFHIFPDNSNPSIWRYKDPSESHQGTLIDLVMNLFSLDFIGAVKKIKEDFNVIDEYTAGRPKEIAGKLKDFIPVLKDKWDESDKDFWKKYGAKGALFAPGKLNVKCLSSFEYTNKDDKKIKIHCTKENPAFLYEKWGKIYRPFNEYNGKKHKFFWIKEKDPDYIFGLDNIPDGINEPLIITGGEKDVVTLQSHGYHAFCLNSETQIPSAAILERIRLKSNIVVCLYDADHTGGMYADKLNLDFKWRTIGARMKSDFSAWNKEGLKDISDWFMETYANNREYDGWIKKETDAVLQIPDEEPVQLQQEGALGKKITLDQEIKHTNYSLKYKDINLLKPGNFMVAVSQPGIGKTLFCEAMVAENVRQLLCKRKGVKIEVDTFFFEIDMPDGRKLLYIDTENTEDDVRIGMNRTYNRLAETIEMDDSVIVGNGFIGTEIWSQINLFKIEDKRKKLEKYLDENDVGFIILDGIQDYASGINDDEKAKELVDWIRYIFGKYDMTGIITIHANKNTEVPAGALGSYLCKWARAVILLKRENEAEKSPNKVITTNFAQGKISKDDKEINQCFVYDREKGYTVSTDRTVSEKKKDWFGAGIDYLFSETSTVSANVIKNYFVDNHKKSVSSIERQLKDYVLLGRLDRTNKGHYNRISQFNHKPDTETLSPSDDSVPF